MRLRPPKPLRAGLWPTRGRFEQRDGDVIGELVRIRSALRRLAAGHEELVARQERLAADQETVRDGVKQVLDGQAELRTRLRRTQALTARVYEALHDWPALLALARAEPAYAGAYTDPDPLVSIPIPTYHSPETLCDRALASVLAQTHTNWEAIVVGDHCTDDTEERVRALGDPRIRFLNLPVREHDPEDPWERWAIKGSIARSHGIELARGRWIAPLSHDDEWDPDHLQTLLHEARQRRAEVVYSRMRVRFVGRSSHRLRMLVRRSLGRSPPKLSSIGAWPPKLGHFGWQSAIFNGALRFLRYDRNCALASEPNDWNLARRAWEVGVRFHHLERETVTLYVYPRSDAIAAEYAAMGLPPSADAWP
jgi:hypothetical protein